MQEVSFLVHALRKIYKVCSPADLAAIRLDVVDEFINTFFWNPDHDVLRSRFRRAVNSVKEAVATFRMQPLVENQKVCPLSVFNWPAFLLSLIIY